MSPLDLREIHLGESIAEGEVRVLGEEVESGPSSAARSWSMKDSVDPEKRPRMPACVNQNRSLSRSFSPNGPDR
jgi:hypothetical protein